MFDRKSSGIASNNKLSFEGLDDRHVTIYKWNPSSLEGRPRVRSEKAVEKRRSELECMPRGSFWKARISNFCSR